MAIPFQPAAADLVYILQDSTELTNGFSEVLRFDYEDYCTSVVSSNGTVEIDLDTETLVFRPQPQMGETHRFWSLRLEQVTPP